MSRRDIGFILLGVFVGPVLLMVFTILSQPAHGPRGIEIAYSAFLGEVEQGNVRVVTFQGSRLSGAFNDGRTFSSHAPGTHAAVDRLIAKNVEVRAAAQDEELPSLIAIIIGWAPWCGALWLFVARPLHAMERRLTSLASLLTQGGGRFDPNEPPR